MNIYTYDELIRIELLGYEQTKEQIEGLHQVERDWWNLAKKLLEDVKELEVALDKYDRHHGHQRFGNMHLAMSAITKIVKRNFPEPFKPTSV